MFDHLYSTLLNPLKPRVIYSAEQARLIAKKRIPRIIFDFMDGATGTESTPKRNSMAFESVNLQPRVLKNVSVRKLNATILGEKFSFPGQPLTLNT